MVEVLITLAIVGSLMGFLFSIPIPGPLYLLIISNGLKGKLRYCYIAAIGASIIDFIYCFIAVFGFTKFYMFYENIVNYVLVAGAVFMVIIGIRTIRTKLDLVEIEKEDNILEENIHKKVKDNTGFITGILVNLANPSLFVAWMISSFIVLSFVASLGLNTGGLDKVLNDNVNKIEKGEHEINAKDFKIKEIYENKVDVKSIHNTTIQTSYPKSFSLIVSIDYALFLSIGTIVWFVLLAFLLNKFRKVINIINLNRIIRVLGVVMCVFGVYLAYYGLSNLL